jgi:hypothetical protein
MTLKESLLLKSQPQRESEKKINRFIGNEFIREYERETAYGLNSKNLVALSPTWL